MKMITHPETTQPAGQPPVPAQTPWPSDAQRAYLNFFVLALRSSLLELRASLDNRARMLEILDGLDLLVENLRKYFRMVAPGRNQRKAALPPPPDAEQLRLGTRNPAAPPRGLS